MNFVIIQKNWQENLILMLFYRSALPQYEDMQETISDFDVNSIRKYTIVSYDCNKSIPLINKKGYVVMPQYL